MKERSRLPAYRCDIVLEKASRTTVGLSLRYGLTAMFALALKFAKCDANSMFFNYGWRNRVCHTAITDSWVLQYKILCGRLSLLQKGRETHVGGSVFH